MTEALVLPDVALASMEPPQAADAFVQHGVQSRASDLFVFSESDGVELAMRRLGRMEKVARLDRAQGRSVLTYIRTMAQMDIADNRRAEDGRWVYEKAGLRLDLRINAMPSLHGFDLAIRILNSAVGLMDLNELGLAPGQLSRMEAMLESPSGLILVSGPSGAGKTTTLYACLRRLNTGEAKINSLEDPVEYALRGVRQTQVSEKYGLTFSELLRNVLRQSPDVIMIGEIRDSDTAETAVRAAGTGHLVLATLHAPTATGAVQSMLALGVNPHFLASCLRGAVAQRMVRVLCPHCRVRYDIADAVDTFAEVESLLEPGYGKTLFGATGCDACYNTGYSERTGLFEVMTMNRTLRELIAAGRPAGEIRAAAVDAGMLELRRAALIKVAHGITTTEEILRDIASEHLDLEEGP
jgi:type II secretory ATPase GspE/PulE/Tfp pilus assembly ATPase PilB-like protein